MINKLGELGYKAIDTDYGGFTVAVDSGGAGSGCGAKSASKGCYRPRMPMCCSSAVALMSLVVIPREEDYLETRFPSGYLPYKASVRRWL